MGTTGRETDRGNKNEQWNEEKLVADDAFRLFYITDPMTLTLT